MPEGFDDLPEAQASATGFEDLPDAGPAGFEDLPLAKPSPTWREYVGAGLQEAQSELGRQLEGATVLAAKPSPRVVQPSANTPLPAGTTVSRGGVRIAPAAPLTAGLLQQIQQLPTYEAGRGMELEAPEAYPVRPEVANQTGIQIARDVGGFAPMVLEDTLLPGAAPVGMGLQSVGEHITNDYDEAVKAGTDPDVAASQALDNAVLSGSLQAGIFTALPPVARGALEKYVVDKFGQGGFRRFLAGRVSAAAEGAALGATSAGAENVVQGKPVTAGTAGAGAGLATMNLLLPWLHESATDAAVRRTVEEEQANAPKPLDLAGLQAEMQRNQITPGGSALAPSTAPAEEAAAAPTEPGAGPGGQPPTTEAAPGLPDDILEEIRRTRARGQPGTTAEASIAPGIEGGRFAQGVRDVLAGEPELTEGNEGNEEPQTYLIRHGATDLNAESGGVDRIRGWMDVPLNDEGREEAGRVADQLKDTGIQAVYTSDLSRAKDTADTIAAATGAKVVTEPDLRPWNVGEFTGLKSEDVAPQMRWYTEHPDQVVPGGESFDQFKARFLDAFRRIQAANPDRTIAISTHYRGTRLIDAWRAAGAQGNDIDLDVFNRKEGAKTGELQKIGKLGTVKEEPPAEISAGAAEPANEQPVQPELTPGAPARHLPDDLPTLRRLKQELQARLDEIEASEHEKLKGTELEGQSRWSAVKQTLDVLTDINTKIAETEREAERKAAARAGQEEPPAAASVPAGTATEGNEGNEGARGVDPIADWLDKAIEATRPDPSKMMEGVTGGPVWLTKAAANGALRVVRAAYRAGRRIADAIAEGVHWLKDQNLRGFDEAQAKEWLEPAVEADPVAGMLRRLTDITEQVNGINRMEERGRMTDQMRGDRWRLNKEGLEIQRELVKHPEYVADLFREMEAALKQREISKKAGNALGANEAGEHARGIMEGQLQQVDPALAARVYNDLVARGEIMGTQAGPITAGRTMAQLTAWLKSNGADSPKLRLRDRFNLVRGLADRFDRGKALVAKLGDRAAAAWHAFVEQYKHPPVDDEFRSVIKDWLYSKQWTGMETYNWKRAIEKEVRDPTRRRAISAWLGAQGDENTLRAQLAELKNADPKISPGARAAVSVWEKALELTDGEKKLGWRIKSEFDQKLQDAMTAFDMRGREDYGVPQVWSTAPKTDGEYDPLTKTPRPRQLGAKLDPRDPFFTLERKNPSYFDGIMLGGVPRDMDVGKLVAAYSSEFHNAIADRGVIKALKDVKGSDGTPIVQISGAVHQIPRDNGGRTIFVDPNAAPKEALTQDGRRYVPIDHWALKDWKFASRDSNGNPIILRGDMLVHPDYARWLKNELETSDEQWKNRLGERGAAALKGAQSTAAFLKASKFASATFHAATIGEHALFHGVAPFSRGVELDPSKNPKLGRLMRNGMELGFGSPQEIFEDGLSSHGGIWSQVPGLGDLMRRQSDWLFKEYIPRIKAKVGMEVLDRNLKRYSGKLSEEQIYELTAQQMNAAFGMQNWRLLGTSKGLLDVSRLLFTAPDFLLSRAKVVAQAFKPYNREQRYFLAAQAVGVYLAARALNMLFDNGNPHWEPENALSVVHNGRSYGARFIVSDLWYMMSHPSEFAQGRIGPFVRTAFETVTGRDMRTGARITVPFKTTNTALRSAQVALKDMAGWLPPVGTEGFLPGAAGREQTGPGQVALALVGVGSRRFTPENQVGGWARDFNRSSPNPVTRAAQERSDDEAHAESPYRELKTLLDADQLDKARAEYQHLLDEGYKPRAIDSSLRPRPFTGSDAIEAAFRKSLNAQEQGVYAQAVAARNARLAKLRQMAAPILQSRFSALPEAAAEQ